MGAEGPPAEAQQNPEAHRSHYGSGSQKSGQNYLFLVNSNITANFYFEYEKYTCMNAGFEYYEIIHVYICLYMHTFSLSPG